VSEAAPLLVARGLSVAVDGRALVEPSDFDLRDGERVLLVGRSGSGKSLFLDLLLGFAGPESPGVRVGGSLALGEEELLGAPPERRDGHLGAVFQLHAIGLFDDLSAEQNLRFGSLDPGRARSAAESLGVGDLDRPVTRCSGGERVRLALARTLLRGAGVIAFDEPTTGLDAPAARQVVEAIRASHRRLTLVVSHDLEAFAPICDAVLLLDPTTRTLRRLGPPAQALPEARAALETERTAPPRALAARASAVRRLAEGWSRATGAVGTALRDALGLVRLPACAFRLGHALDGPRLRLALRRNLAPGVLAFVGVGAVLMALTATWFLFERMPQREVAEPLLQDEVVAGLGLVSVRVVVPLLASVLLAAKLGASASAQWGHMSMTRQVDALLLLGVGLRRHLLEPVALAQVLAALLATTLSLLLAFSTSLVIFLVLHPGWSVRWYADAFAREIGAGDLLWIAAKVSVAALAVALVAFRSGVSPKRAPEEVLRGIHRTLLLGLLLVLAVHAAFAFLEF
jgi:ABC-type multidrug transport system ATPase subunit